MVIQILFYDQPLQLVLLLLLHQRECHRLWGHHRLGRHRLIQLRDMRMMLSLMRKDLQRQRNAGSAGVVVTVIAMMVETGTGTVAETETETAVADKGLATPKGHDGL